jgi:hypothetical protein
VVEHVFFFNIREENTVNASNSNGFQLVARKARAPILKGFVGSNPTPGASNIAKDKTPLWHAYSSYEQNQ